MKVIVC